MIFNSIPFLILFSVTFLVYWNVGNQQKKYILLLSSVLFYLYFSIYVTLHFLSVVTINYLFSQKLLAKKQKGENTTSGIRIIILLNFLNLCVFKYFYFFMDSVYFITGYEEVKAFSKSVSIVLPLAISFYTFQLIAIQVDIHRNKITEKIAFLDYYIFILFFPQLISGPIMRTGDFLPQINSPAITKESMYDGMLFILSGLFKKVVIADNIGPIIFPLYENPSHYNGWVLLIGCMGFACQVYSDFSGYTDMARGLAKMLGYEIPENFGGPFLSQTFKELWSRWHITLSTWLRDYIYIPLGGSRQNKFRSHINLMITMALGGLWHGANITFLFWGVYLGVLIVIERILEDMGWKKQSYQNIFLKILKTTVVFVLFAMSGTFFRAGIAGENSVKISYEFFKNILTFSDGIGLYRLNELYIFIFVTLLFNYAQYNPAALKKFANFRGIIVSTFSVIMLLLLGLFGDGGGNFLYFQF
ncbi:MAG: MBOAT family protein [Leptospiraceae bacterium]|nr:MBOAT family protein [Leptospiraceae bacterium]MCP5496257.1 MBOAT family protein [Leptospiraceae bacterium]